MSAKPTSFAGNSPRIDRRTFAPAALLVVVIAVMIGAIGIRPPGKSPDERNSIPAAALVSDSTPTSSPNHVVVSGSTPIPGNDAASWNAECTTAPSDLSRIDAQGDISGPSAITPVDLTIYEGPANRMDWRDAPTGPAAAQEDVAGITSTVEQFVACANAHKAGEASALFSDDYWKRINYVGQDIDRGTPGMYLNLPYQDPLGPLEMPTIANTFEFGDGRIGAELHTSSAVGLNYELVVLVKSSDTWLIDEAMLVFKRPSIDLEVNDTGFSASTIYVAGAKTDLVLTNTGSSTHSIVIEELGIRMEVAPGETAIETIVYGEATLPFHSDMPDDTGPGFSGEVIIEVAGGDGSNQQATPEAAPSLDNSNGFIFPVLQATIEVSSPSNYSPDAVALIANRDAQLVLTNTNPGTVGNFTIDALGIDVDIPIGESVTVTINAEPGIYVFYCNQPYSAVHGMYGTLLVLDPDDPEAGFSH
ncbi:MAG: cupredoxin domain-containing protein [Thermomicrobiales bacterium]